jgi:hypothetical protein
VNAVLAVGDSSESPAATIGHHSGTRLEEQCGIPEIVTLDYGGKKETDNADNIDDTMDQPLPRIPEFQDYRWQACELPSIIPSSSPISPLLNTKKPTNGAGKDRHEGDFQSQVQYPARELVNKQGELNS